MKCHHKTTLRDAEYSGRPGVKVLDFGLAKMKQSASVAGDTPTILTTEGTIASASCCMSRAASPAFISENWESKGRAAQSPSG